MSFYSDHKPLHQYTPKELKKACRTLWGELKNLIKKIPENWQDYFLTSGKMPYLMPNDTKVFREIRESYLMFHECFVVFSYKKACEANETFIDLSRLNLANEDERNSFVCSVKASFRMPEDEIRNALTIIHRIETGRLMDKRPSGVGIPAILQ